MRHLRRVDPHLQAIIDRVGPCRLEPQPDRFGALVRSIISQQISTKAAASINVRLVAIGGEPHQPERLIELGEARLAERRALGGQGPLCAQPGRGRRLRRRPARRVRRLLGRRRDHPGLTAVKGIGVWTAEMFLIFASTGPTCLPAGDLGVRVGLRDRHGLAELPSRATATPWPSPGGRTAPIASWYLWRGTDTPRPVVPRSTPSGQPRIPAQASAIVESQREARGREIDA